MRNILEISNTNAVEIAPGGTATFDKVLFKSGCCGITKHGNLPASVNGNGAYKLSFHGNITGEAGTYVELALAVNGVDLPETLMTASSSSLAGRYINVSAGTMIGKKCRCEGSVTISLKNVGDNAVTIAPNAVLIVEEVA